MEKLSNKEMLMLGMVMGSDSILHQEKHGQGQVVMNDVIPIDCPKSDLEQLGFVFGDKADDLFYNVRFPDGWSKQGTDHSMYTNILDDKGRVRGSIGYKAAFYDRWASCHLVRRYGYKYEVEDYSLDVHNHAVKDCDGTVLFSGTIFFENMFDDNGEKASKECRDWLDKNYPNWQDELAYWD